MSALITCSHVDFGYENQDAVIDLTMDVEEGEYLCVVGANGSGKSTLVKGLLGLLKPTGGSLVVSEELKKTGSATCLSRPWHRRIFLPQSGR